MVSSVSILRVLLCVVFIVLIHACKTSGPGIFGKKTPHDQYSDRIKNAGLSGTVLGNSWFTVAAQSLSSPLTIPIPYSETGYFSADRPAAAGLRFDVVRGQKLFITVEKKPVQNFNLYIDLWKIEQGKNEPAHITAADTSNYTIRHEVKENAQYILRVQPELLSSGEYSVTITTGPSLAYPIKAPGKNHIKSFWGAERDGGARKHEGIDIFSSFRTPVVAAAEGRVTRVMETPVGGKVVWLRVKDADYTLYYAHLDSQIVQEGEMVKTGDTLGLMGNTGNARTTAPHLHFGVYTFTGPIDPLPFINPNEKPPENISASTILLGKVGRTITTSSKIHNTPTANDQGTTIPPNTILRIEAATSNWYKIRLPSGEQGFLKSAVIDEADKPLRSIAAKSNLAIFEKPDSLGAKKASIPTGESADVLGNFLNYHLIKTRQDTIGWIVR